MIHQADKLLRRRWEGIFHQLPEPAREALREALLALRLNALKRAEHSWRKHKAPMALYWKVLGVYAGKLAHALGPKLAPTITTVVQGEAGKQSEEMRIVKDLAELKDYRAIIEQGKLYRQKLKSSLP